MSQVFDTRRQIPVTIAPCKPLSSHIEKRSSSVGSDSSQTRKCKTVKSCTCCRQLKIKCNASSVFPNPCSNCVKKGKVCEIDPLFKPIHNVSPSQNSHNTAKHKANQLENLRTEIETLKSDIKHLLRTESLLSKDELANKISSAFPSPSNSRSSSVDNAGEIISDGAYYSLNRVTLNKEQGNKLICKFFEDYAPYLPIRIENDAIEIHSKSPLLFWSMCLTACLSNEKLDDNDKPDSLYNQIHTNITPLITRCCLLSTSKTPTYDIYALLILSVWPLPNLNNDKSYRFVTLAKTLGYQIGLNRGQNYASCALGAEKALIPNGANLINQLWNGIYIVDQFWCATLGYPSALPTDYFIEQSLSDIPSNSAEKFWKNMLKIAHFNSKLVQTVATSTVNITGLVKTKDRVSQLMNLNSQLSNMLTEEDLADKTVSILYHYSKLILCSYGFLLDVDFDDQSLFVQIALHSGAEISKLADSCKQKLHRLPIFIRNALNYSSLLLFKLHLSSMLPFKYVPDARAAIIKIYKLYKHTATYSSVTDITRTINILEKLNIVITLNPEVIVSDKICSHISGHLSACLTYELFWCLQQSKNLSSLPNTPKSSGNPDDNSQNLSFATFEDLVKEKDMDDEAKSNYFLKSPFPLPFETSSGDLCPILPRARAQSIEPISKKARGLGISLPHINELRMMNKIDLSYNDDNQLPHKLPLNKSNGSNSITELNKYNLRPSYPSPPSGYLSPPYSRTNSLSLNKLNQKNKNSGAKPLDTLIQGINWLEQNSSMS